MSGAISTERIFSLSCFEGLRLLRQYGTQQHGLETPKLIKLIENIEADAQSLDMEASVYLSMLVPQDCPLDGHVFYQSCIKAVLLKHQPIWSKTMRAGRIRFINTLGENDHDIFEAAGLMGEPPTAAVVAWWDDVAGHARLIADQKKMEQAREAELLTIEYERKRLAKIGIDKVIGWPGFDDNYAGYDVLSYDLSDSGIVIRLIEVKSTIASPLRFNVTRNEWNKAVQAGDAYIFHIWDMSKTPAVLCVRTVTEVAPHIPEDNEKGVWKHTLIPVVNN